MELLFVCEGNTCRSAMAEKIAQALALEAGLENVHARSAGLAAFPGDGAKPEAVRVCSTHGLDLSEHRSQALTTDMAEAADHIYTMTLLQAAQLRAILPRQAAKIQPLSPAGEIADPRRPEDYDSVYEQLETALGVRLAEWKQEKEK